MQKFTLFAAVTAAMMLVPQMGAAKVSKASSDLVISKVYFAGYKPEGGKNYRSDQYMEILNNSRSAVDLGGMYIGLTESDTKTFPIEQKGDTVYLRQLFRIPAATEVVLNPGETFIITNSAVDHRPLGGRFDLSDADYEVATSNGNYTQHNANTPKLELVYTSTESIDFINFMNSGPSSMVLIKYDFDATNPSLVQQYDKPTSKTFYMKVPTYKVIDGVDIFKQTKTGPDTSMDYLPSSVDAGYVCVDSASTFKGGVVFRKNKIKAGDYVRLYDSNNSCVDWATSFDVYPRQFADSIYGVVKDSVVVIPETGYLAVKPSMPFIANGVTLTTTNSSNTADRTDLSYTTLAGDTTIAMASPYILTGAPGEHKLLFTSATPNVTGSTNMSWEDVTPTTVSNTKGRLLYKWVNTDEFVGFERDEKYAATSYASIDLAEGEHLYISVTAKAIENIEKNTGVEVGSIARFAWHGIKPSEVTGIETVQGARFMIQGETYNLQGQKLNDHAKGLVIKNGKLMLIK